MKELVKRYIDFLSTCKTERECVSFTVAQAEKHGYRNIDTVDSLKAGDKVYFNQMGKAVALFNIGTDPIENGVNYLCAHIDSPRIDIKQNPMYESEDVIYLDTHYYGGIKKYQWVTIPLAMHGIVCKKDGTSVKVVVGEDPEDPVLTITDILVHLSAEQMKNTASDFIKGEDLDVLVGLTPDNCKDEKDGGKKFILSLLNDKYGIEEADFLSAELEIVPAGRARQLGLDRSMILGYGHDDRCCAYTSLEAMLEEENVKKTSCCILVDKEEIGSTGASGMDSRILENTMSELVARLGEFSHLTVLRALKNSTMLSSDVSSTYDPLHTDLYDKKNSAKFNGGVVFNKFTGSRGKSGSSDACPELIAKLRKVLDDANVRFQLAELSKVDMGGGGTIARFAASYNMKVIDAGIPVMSMHAPWETIAAFDLWSAKCAYKEFLRNF